MKLHRSHAKPKPLSGSFRYGSMRVVQIGPVYIVANACLSGLVRIWRRGVPTSAHANMPRQTHTTKRSTQTESLFVPVLGSHQPRHYRIMQANVCCYALCVHSVHDGEHAVTGSIGIECVSLRRFSETVYVYWRCVSGCGFECAYIRITPRTHNIAALWSLILFIAVICGDKAAFIKCYLHSLSLYLCRDAGSNFVSVKCG